MVDLRGEYGEGVVVVGGLFTLTCVPSFFPFKFYEALIGTLKAARKKGKLVRGVIKEGWETKEQFVLGVDGGQPKRLDSTASLSSICLALFGLVITRLPRIHRLEGSDAFEGPSR
jgi:hypothetical protein